MAGRQITERPILFPAPMVRAILDDRKTQTRRIVSPHNSEFGSANRGFWDHADFDAPHPGTLIDGSAGGSQYLHVPCHCQDRESNYPLAKPIPDCAYCKEWGWEGTRNRLYCRWDIGDRLWVRETFRETFDIDQRPVMEYRAGGTRLIDGKSITHGEHRATSVLPKWRPSIFMPRWASRITLEITDIGVERLNSITEEDAEAEGPTRMNCGDFGMERWTSAFRNLWIDIKGHGSWEKNPWVWKISFKRIGFDEC